MIAKPRIGLFGNCQAAEIQRLFSGHRPLLDRCELVPIKPVYLMSIEEREQFMSVVPTLDILFCQFTTTNYAPTTTDNIRAVATGQVLELPSMHFTGHLPDIMYLKPGTGDGAPTSYHSTIIASGFAKRLTERDVEAFYDDAGALSYSFLAENYWAGIAELKRREERCAFTISDYVAKQGPARRLFHTMNHPERGIIHHVANQILAHLNVSGIDTQEADRLATIQWPVTAAVANLFGVSKERLFSFGSSVSKIPLSKMISDYFSFYRSHPVAIEANAGKLNPAWLSF